MPGGTIVNIPGKTVRKVAELFRGMGIELPELQAISQISTQAKFLADADLLMLLPADYEELCAYLLSTLDNSSFSDQVRNTAAFIWACLKCNEHQLPYVSSNWLGLLQLTPLQKATASELFEAFVGVSKKNARANLTISDALQSNIFWSLLTYLPHIDDRDMPKDFMSLYHDDILHLIQTSLTNDKISWPDGLQKILDVYFKHSSSEKNKTKAAYAIWQHIDHIPEQQRQEIKEQCLKAIDVNFLTDEIPTAETLLAQADDLLAHNIPLFMRGLQQTLAAYNIYDDMTEVVVLLTQRRTLDKIREKIPPMGKGCDSLLSPAVEEIENVHANLSLYIALKEASVTGIEKYLLSTRPRTLNTAAAHAMLLCASNQYNDKLRKLAWKTVKQHDGLRSKFTPESLFNIVQQSKLSLAARAGTALEVLEHFHPLQGAQAQRSEQEKKVQFLVKFVERFNNNVSDTLYYPLLKKAYTNLSADQFVIAFEQYQRLKQPHDSLTLLPFDDKQQRHANFLISEMLTRCTDLLTFPLLQQMLETTRDPKTRIEVLKKILSQSVEDEVMRTLADRYPAEIKKALSSETTTPNCVRLYRRLTATKFPFQQLSPDKQLELYKILTQEERYTLAEQRREPALIKIILQNTRSAANISLKILEKLQEHVLQEVFNIVEIIEYRNKIYNDPTMLTTKLLPWIEQLAPPAKNKLAQIIFDNAERIQDLQSMKHCRIVIDALTVEDAALRRFFDSLTQSRNILIEGLIELAESFAGRPQARSYLARAILQDARRLNACGASLDTVVAMLAPKDIVEIVDIQIASRTMLTAELALKFIQTGHLTSEQVKRLAPICLFTRNTAAAFLAQNRLNSNALLELLKARLDQEMPADLKERIISSQLIPLGNADTQMHNALKLYLQDNLPMFAAVSSSLRDTYIQDTPIGIAINITGRVRVSDKQAWVERYLLHNTPSSGKDIMELLTAIEESNRRIKNLANIFPRLSIATRVDVAQLLFETPDFFNMPVVDEGTFSLFISQCTNLPDDVEDPTRRLRVLVANNPHISSLAAQILLKDYSIQLPDAEFNALCNRLEISEIKRLVEDTVNALGIPAQADAAKTLLEKLAQNERIKKQLNEQANHTEQTAYFRLYYGHTEAQEIARDILQVTTPALLDRLCNCQQHANIRMAARLKLDAARLTLNEHADNIAQLAALAQNTQDITAPIDREAQCLGTVVKRLNQDPHNFINEWKFTDAPNQVLALAQFLLYPAVVKSKLLDRRAIVVIKQQEQAALDVLHKDKNWLSRAWEKFKYNVAQSWTRMVASKTPHDSLREVINKTEQLTFVTTTGSLMPALGDTSARRQDPAEEASLQEVLPTAGTPPVAGEEEHRRPDEAATLAAEGSPAADALPAALSLSR